MLRAPSRSATEPPLAMASPPSALISATTSFAAWLEPPLPSTAAPRSFTTTRAPRRASSSAWALPSPPPAPVTIATFPSKLTAMTSSSGGSASADRRPGREWRPALSSAGRCSSVVTMESPGSSADAAVLRRERDLYLRLLDLGHEVTLAPFLKDALGLLVEITGAQEGYLELYDDDDQPENPRWWMAHGLSD